MDNKKLGKWVLAGVIGLGMLFFALPILSTIIWNAVSVIVGMMVLGGLYFLLPALAEVTQQGAFWLWYNAIARNPVAKLWRELAEFGHEIEKLDDNTSEVVSARTQMEAELKKQWDVLDPADRLDWRGQIDELKTAEQEIHETRVELQQEFFEMERTIKREEGNWKLAKAQGKAADALVKAGKISAGTDGGRVALSAIQDRLAQSKARLKMARDKRSIDFLAKKNMKDAAAAANNQVQVLVNNPSPILTTNAAALQAVPVDLKQAQVSDKLSKFLGN